MPFELNGKLKTVHVLFKPGDDTTADVKMAHPPAILSALNIDLSDSIPRNALSCFPPSTHLVSVRCRQRDAGTGVEAQPADLGFHDKTRTPRSG